MSPVVVLVGAPGSGKSTVGRLIADRLGVDFRDSDADIEAAAGQKIADIFVDHGEPYFRALEKAAVKEALAGHDGVLALGGGAVLDAGTRVLLKAHRVVFLDVTLPDAAARVGLNRDRPLLLGNVRGTLMKLMDERRPLYEEVAVLTVRTDREPEEIAADIVESLKK
ncbi:MAG: shikimate kinase [Catenulispora sp. 13_1_20CM_3_70_7]|nr:shikimate kinase [Catenulisporales bacterium]OLE20194.1 MAG: shikimate kinase [Catenulispora sp. 13_1_20CM_3_70_7]